jgi:hypothetical protein
MADSREKFRGFDPLKQKEEQMGLPGAGKAECRQIKMRDKGRVTRNKEQETKRETRSEGVVPEERRGTTDP